MGASERLRLVNRMGASERLRQINRMGASGRLRQINRMGASGRLRQINPMGAARERGAAKTWGGSYLTFLSYADRGRVLDVDTPI